MSETLTTYLQTKKGPHHNDRVSFTRRPVHACRDARLEEAVWAQEQPWKMSALQP